MENELKALIQRRGTLKSQVTRFRGYLDKWADNPDVEQLIERTDKFRTLIDVFDEIQTRIDIMTPDKEIENTNERAGFEELYYELLAKAKRRINASRASVQANVQGTTASVANTKVKLPTIELPKFNGRYENWLYFYDSFKSIVHDNKELNPVQKLHYLRSCLSDEAAQIIQALETTNQNYEVAWKLLTERFDNRRRIIQSHIRELFEIQRITKESSIQLRSLIDNALRHLRALKALGQPTESWDAMLLHLITTKLDRYSHKEWEKSIDGTMLPALDDLFKFLQNRCHVLETVQQESTVQQRGCVKNFTAHSNNTEKTKSQYSHVTVKDKIKCIYCGQGHNIYICEQFLNLDVSERSKYVKHKGLCYNCLRANHLVKDCRSSACKKCKHRHHSLLHQDNVAVRDEKRGDINIMNNTSTSLQAIVTTQVILSTATVNILDKDGNYHKCKLLLDSGSQSNFITEDLANILGLSKSNVDIPVIGFNETLTNIKQSVRTSIKSNDGRFTVTLSFLIVPKITGRIPVSFIKRDDLNIPTNIRLADPHFYVPGEINLLIGAELFYQLLCIGQIQLNQHGLTLQKTRFGWVLSGKVSSNKEGLNNSMCNIAIDTLNNKVERFWESEDIPGTRFLSEQEKECERHFVKNTYRNDSGRYTVRLPFNQHKAELGDSYQNAQRRLYSLERRLIKNKQLYQEYTNFLTEYIKLGHMEEVDNVTSIEKTFYTASPDSQTQQ